MNCDDCKVILSLYLDNELDEIQAAGVRAHIAACDPCAKLCEDLSSILFTCGFEEGSELVPPNSQALWCRISNTIESEIKPPPPAVEAPRKRFWSLSLPQLVSAVLLIAVLSSLLTVVGIRNYMQPAADDIITRSTATQTTFEKVLSKVGLMETPQHARDRHIKEQLAAITYWDDRVQSRRVKWDERTREAFDRNLQVIDESLNQYKVILQQDPEDDLSEEMLDSVMTDKMNLLRDFSDL
ncbi:MAG: zf-HC2 domain-containing protein [Acidobacteriota bacterium]